VKSGFIRTPKKGDQMSKSYKTKIDWVPYGEIFMGFYCCTTMVVAVTQGVLGGLVFFFFYGVGFLVTGFRSLQEQKVTSS